MVATIVYPSGSHGSFLTFLLNSLSGSKSTYNGEMVYDRIKFDDRQYFYSKISKNDDKKIINITVGYNSYLKYLAVCLSRTAGYNLSIEEFGHDAYNKLQNHIVLRPFVKPLLSISKNKNIQVEMKDLREWARLCFFDLKGTTITQIIQSSVVNDADYYFDFDWFYSQDTILEKCYEILDRFKRPVDSSIDILPLIEQFYFQNRYKNIDQIPNQIIHAIKNKTELKISNTNFLQEAWVDNWLVDSFKIDPLYRNEYFINTLDIIDHYHL